MTTFATLEPQTIIPDRGPDRPGLRYNALDVMVDIDDVVFPLIDSIHRLAYERGLHDGTLPAHNWVGWEQYGCPEEVYWDLWADFALANGYLVTEPIPGAVEALRRLYWAGHRIHIVTARGFMANADLIREWTPVWLAEFGVPHHSLSFARDKPAIQDELAVRFDYAIDDSPKNYEALDNAGVEVYLQSHPHNATYDAARRVESVEQFVDIILKETV